MMKHEDHRFSEQSDAKSVGSLTDFNADDYRPFLEGLELDRDQEDALMRIVWDMMRMSVEMNVPAESWGRIVDAITDGSADESGDVD